MRVYTKISGELFGLFFLVALSLTGCAHVIKTDMDTYLHNREEYKRKKIVFAADLEDLVDRYDLYRGREVELTAPITYFGQEDFYTWYLMLGSGEKTIRAYEENYHNYINQDFLEVVTGAKNEGGEVTIRGKLEEQGIELNQLVYNERLIHTNRRPYTYRSCYRSCYRSYEGYYDSWINWNYNYSY